MSYREAEYMAYQASLPSEEEEMREVEEKENRLKEIEKQYEKLGKPARFDVYVAGEYNDVCDHISEALMIAEQHETETITLKHTEDEND